MCQSKANYEKFKIKDSQSNLADILKASQDTLSQKTHF